FFQERQELLDEAQDSLNKAAKRMKKYADRNQRDLEFQIRDKVMLKLTPQIWKKINSKSTHRGLIPKYDGPFEVMKKVGNVAYRLKLPDRLTLHPTFHVSFLKPYYGDEQKPQRGQTSRNPPTICIEFEREVERILTHRRSGIHRKFKRVEYLMKWKNAPESEASWEQDTTLWQFEKQIQDYLSNQSTRASGSSGGGGLLAP